MIAGIIQARMNSSRLPGKIMLKACGKTMLELMIERIQRSKKLDKVIIATTTNPKDDTIEEFCIDKKIEYFRGSEEDVLSRYKHTADKFGSDIIVRICSDCPLIDPKIIDETISVYLSNKYDFVNTLSPNPRSFPDGMGIEVFSHSILNEAFQKAKKLSEREHVTFFMWMQPEKFAVHRLDCKQDFSKYRLNLDYVEDYNLIKSIFENLYTLNHQFTMEDIINWLNDNPEILKLNAHIKPNQGWLKSFEKDKEIGFI